MTLDMDSSETGDISTVVTLANIVRVVTVLGDGTDSKIDQNSGDSRNVSDSCYITEICYGDSSSDCNFFVTKYS